MRRALAAIVLFTSIGAAASTIDNDDSCDISLLPAATLLLPYFEVDIEPAYGTTDTTIFTVTNVSQFPQIARVTLWTDLAYPVFTFNLYLTGYDVQSINLFDVIAHGKVAPDDGTGVDVSPIGRLSRANANHPAYDNPIIDEQSCAGLPVELNAAMVARMRSAFTTGRASGANAMAACNTAGEVHINAAGYVTIDVVGRCGSTMPNDPAYYAGDIRFDNVLIGDYHQIRSREDFAQGGTMVHIRAIPEGGTPETRAGDSDYRVNLPRTFYSAYQDPARPLFDARQPLPSLFAARWIEGFVGGFETFYKVWRESRNPAACRDYNINRQEVRDPVRFDEEENPEAYEHFCLVPCLPPISRMSSSSLIGTDRDDHLPANAQGAVAGWMYLNLDDRQNDDVARQAWVVVSMRAEDRFSTDFDALALGNGCSAPVGRSEANPYGTVSIGPAPNKRK